MAKMQDWMKNTPHLISSGPIWLSLQWLQY